MEEKIRDLEVELRMSKDACETLNSENEVTVETLQMKLLEIKNEMTNVLSGVGKDEEEKKNRYEIYENNLHEQRKIIEELKKELEELGIVVHEKDRFYEQLRAKNSEEENKINFLIKEKMELHKKCEEYNQELSERIKENVNLLDSLDRMVIEGSKQKNSAMFEIERLKKRLKDMQHENEDLNEKFELLDQECVEEKNIRERVEADLDDKGKRLEEIEEALSDKKQQLKALETKLVEKTRIMGGLKKENEELEDKFEGERRLVETMKNVHERKLEELCNQDVEKDSVMNQLQTELSEKTELAAKLESEYEDLKAKNEPEYERQQNIIKALEGDLCEKDLKLLSADELVKKLEKNLHWVGEENESSKQQLKQNRITTDKLRKMLDVSCAKLEEKRKLCDNYRVNIDSCYETNAQRDLNIRSLQNKNSELETVGKEFEKQMKELKEALSDCVEKHENVVEQINKQHKKEISKVQNERDKARNKSQNEVNELLNNFSELESELNFCQDEMTSKSEETEELRKQMKDLSISYQDKEKTLLRDLKTLNEQNEIILQNEILKFKTDYDGKLLEMRQANTAEVNNIQNEFHAKLTSLEKLYEETNNTEVEKHTKNGEEKFLLIKGELDCAKEKLKLKAEEQLKEASDHQRILKTKDVELDSKTRIIEKIGKRIETQQKLIDYVMKSLIEERSKQKQPNVTENILAELQTQFHDKFELLKDGRHFDRDIGLYSSFMSNGTNSEICFSPTQSQRSSRFRDHVKSEDFRPYFTSSPEYKSNETATWQNYTSNHVRSYLDSVENDRLCQSMPESGFREIHRASPGLQLNAKTLYYAEQIRSIGQTFEEMELASKDGPQSKRIDLDILKQRIHYRLKVIEDNMSQIDTASYSSRASSKFSCQAPSTRGSDVTFHPTSDEIRKLIDNVNRRYEILSSPYRRYHTHSAGYRRYRPKGNLGQ